MRKYLSHLAGPHYYQDCGLRCEKNKTGGMVFVPHHRFQMAGWFILIYEILLKNQVLQTTLPV
jgi:hypothetical protein